MNSSKQLSRRTFFARVGSEYRATVAGSDGPRYIVGECPHERVGSTGSSESDGIPLRT